MEIDKTNQLEIEKNRAKLLMAQIDAMQNSLSWRLTKPLRLSKFIYKRSVIYLQKIILIGKEKGFSSILVTLKRKIFKVVFRKNISTITELTDVYTYQSDDVGVIQNTSEIKNEITLTKPTLKISWIIPGISINSGGHRNILRAAYFLELFGHEIELYFTDNSMGEEELRHIVHTYFYPLNCRMHAYVGKINPTDVLFATHWSTVSPVLKAKTVARQLMYFVQDFEPLFSPMGSEYILAENTYRQGLYHITSGPWCEKILRNNFGVEADHFIFPVDKKIYWPRPRTYQPKNILFFAKPEVPRRCFQLGIMALERVHKMKPDIEIILFGSQHLQQQNFSFPVTIKSVLPALDDLALLYSNADLGIIFSTTNPSLIPYEMIACGLPVVDLKLTDNEVNYDNRMDMALLVDSDPDKMAKQICDLLDNQHELSTRGQKGLEWIKIFPSEMEMGKRIETLILSKVQEA